MKWPCQKLAANCSGKGTASWGWAQQKKFEMAKSVPPCLALFGRSRDRAGNKRPKSFEDGQAALQRGDLDAAERDFKSVLAVDPKAGPAYTNLGVIAMRRKNWDEAVRLLRKAERLQPNEPGIRLNLGLVEYKRGNYRMRLRR